MYEIYRVYATTIGYNNLNAINNKTEQYKFVIELLKTL